MKVRRFQRERICCVSAEYLECRTLLAADPITFRFPTAETLYAPEETSTEFDNQVLSRDDNFIPIDIEVRAEGTEAIINSVWQDNVDGRGFYVWTRLTESEFIAKHAEHRDNGFRLIDQESYTLNGVQRYAGIWIDDVENLDWRSDHAVSESTFEAILGAYESTHVPADVDVFEVNGEIRYSLILVDNGGNTTAHTLFGMTASAFDAEAALRQDTHQLVDVEKYVIAGEERFASVWHARVGEQRQLRSSHSESETEFFNSLNRYHDQGFRLFGVEATEIASGLQYTGTWLQNSDRVEWYLREQVDSIVSDFYAVQDVPGIGVAIAEAGELTYLRGFGFQDIDDGKEYSGQTVNRLASVSKAVAGALTLELEEQGVVQLDGRSDTWFQTLPPEHTHTLGQLASNRGGVRHYQGTGDPTSGVTTQYNTAQDASLLFVNDEVETPGEQYSYSTHGYTILGGALEGATGQTIEHLVASEIAAPLGLASLKAERRNVDAPQRATLYTSGTHTEADADNISWKVLGGGLEASVEDLARFGTALTSESLLTPQSLQTMWTAPDSLSPYGMGWDIDSLVHGTVSKSGGQLGASTYLTILPQKDIVVAVTINRASSSFDNRASTIATEILAAVDTTVFTVTNTLDGGPGSLRQAIEDANTNNGVAAIHFNIPGPGPQRISPLTALPDVTNVVTINGWTQPGYIDRPLIELSGEHLSDPATNGLTIRAGFSTIRGLIINRFPDEGIDLIGGDGNHVEGNWIGLAADGLTAAPNGDEGVLMQAGSSYNTIGGGSSVSANYISGNSGAGVEIWNVSDNRILGNVIGLGIDHLTSVGNTHHGVELRSGATDNIIGLPGETGNIIAYNGGSGVAVIDTATIRNRISANDIYNNGGLGIDLMGDGVTVNDAGDGDAGPNGLTNFPLITTAFLNAGELVVDGVLSGMANREYQIELFAASEPDATGFGEGRYLTTFDVVTDSNGNAGFGHTITSEFPTERFITATATDFQNNTSEFSAAREVPLSLHVAIDTQPLAEDDGTVTGVVTRNGDLSSDLIVDLASLRGDVTFEEIVAPSVQIVTGPTDAEFRDLGLDPVSGEVGIVGKIDDGSDAGIASLFELFGDRSAFGTSTLVGLGPDTIVLGIASDATRVAGVSKSTGSTSVGEGTTWLRHAADSPTGVGFVDGVAPTTPAVGAWANGVVGFFNGGDGGYRWTSSTGIQVLDGDDVSAGDAIEVSANGINIVGFSTLLVAAGGATEWVNNEVFALPEPFHGQSKAEAISPDGSWIGGWVFELQLPFVPITHAAVWDANRDLILLQDGSGAPFQGAVSDVSDSGYAVGKTIDDRGFIWHPTFDGVQSPFNGAQVFDDWLTAIPGGQTLPTASTEVVAIAEDTTNGMLLFAVEGTDEAYFVQASAPGIMQIDTITIPSGQTSTTFRINAVDNFLLDGNRTETVSVAATGYASTAGMLNIIDDDNAGFHFREFGPDTTVNESGTTDIFDVVLDAQPASDVTIAVSSGDTGEVTVDKTTLTFTPANWNIGQVVTVTGVDDSINDDDQVTAITLSIDAGNSDDSFDPLSDQVVQVTTVDEFVDLVSIRFNAVSDLALLGQTDVTFQIRNNGNVAAGTFTTHVVWSLNDVLGDTDDMIVAGSGETITSLAAGATTDHTSSLQLDTAALYAHARASNLPGQPVGTISTEASHLFLVVDPGNEVAETNESNNSGVGHLIDSDDITWFPWDKDLNGTITPIDAIKTIQAIGTSDPASDFDGNGIVTPQEALDVLQRIGYVRNESVIGDAPSSGLTAGSPAASSSFVSALANVMQQPPGDDEDENGLFALAPTANVEIPNASTDDFSDLDAEFTEVTDWLSVI